MVFEVPKKFALARIDRFDIQTNQFVRIGQLNAQKYCANSFYHNNSIYVAGAFNINNQREREIHQYDLATNQTYVLARPEDKKIIYDMDHQEIYEQVANHITAPAEQQVVFNMDEQIAFGDGVDVGKTVLKRSRCKSDGEKRCRSTKKIKPLTACEFSPAKLDGYTQNVVMSLIGGRFQRTDGLDPSAPITFGSIYHLEAAIGRVLLDQFLIMAQETIANRLIRSDNKSIYNILLGTIDPDLLLHHFDKYRPTKFRTSKRKYIGVVQPTEEQDGEDRDSNEEEEQDGDNDVALTTTRLDTDMETGKQDLFVTRYQYESCTFRMDLNSFQVSVDLKLAIYEVLADVEGMPVWVMVP
eukprot:gene12267-14378_t